jgi:tetratricopeptide (TPR) repeat protein
MPSHIYLRTGNYAAAVKSNQQAIVADQEYKRQQPVAPAGVMGYANHDQHFLAVAAGMDGEFETALDAAKEIQMHVHNEAMASMYTLVLLRFSKWDEILAEPAPDSALKGVTFLWHLARGCARVAKTQFKEAADEQTAMERAFSALPAGRAFGIFFNDWSTLHSLASDELAARIAAARGNLGVAIAHWRHAVSVEDQMNFDDVPDWYYPMRESLGAALLRNRQAAEAERVFRQDLKRNPNNPRSLFGLCTALEAQHKSAEAAEVRRSFQAAWKGKAQLRLEDL